MIKSQIIKQGQKPIAIILDYKEYLKLRELAQDKEDYKQAIMSLKKSKKLYSHKEVKEKLGL